MAELRDEHLPVLATALKGAIISRNVSITAARNFCDAVFDIVQEEMVNERERQERAFRAAGSALKGSNKSRATGRSSEDERSPRAVEAD